VNLTRQNGDQPGTWADRSIVVGGGNSGGPVFVADPANHPVIAGTVTVGSNPVIGRAAAGGGVLLTPQQVLTLTRTIESVDLGLGRGETGYQTGWWNTQPVNDYVLGDPANGPVVTDDRSDNVYLGKATQEVVGSLGNDNYYGTAASVTNGTLLRYTAAGSDSADTKAALAEIRAMVVKVQLGQAGFGNAAVTLTDTQGGTSTQTISGIGDLQLSNGPNVIDLGDMPSPPPASGSGGGNSPVIPEAPMHIDGGAGNNVFKIDYDGIDQNAKPVLLESGKGNDTFNIADANDASFSVLWGGDGSDTFNISSSAGSSRSACCI
jgi:hypothetical protein